MVSPDGERMAALSIQLSQAHQELRRQISEIKAGLGHRRLDDDRLVTHCLAFCAALSTHHQGEDAGMFAQLLRERPDLAPTIAKLVDDHEQIGAILTRVRELAARATEARGAALDAISGELDGLMAIMESHFGFEERAISKALDDSALGSALDADWPAAVFRFEDPAPSGSD